MPALSDRKIEVVRTLVESAPDTIVGGLSKALAETGEDSTLAPVRQLVEAELADRLLRNTVFLPVAPLCIGDGTHAQKLTFPGRALALVWRGLKAAHPQDIAAAAEAARAFAEAQAAQVGQHRLPDPSKTYDEIVQTALHALRDPRDRDFKAAAELLDKARPDGAKAFCGCL